MADGAARPLLLDAASVEVSYGDVPVLFGVDLDVRRGEAVALVGTNGAGKSSLLRAVSGLAPLTSGSITFDGTELRGRPAHRIATLGLIQMPGGQGIFPTLTVAENLQVATWLYRRDRRAARAGMERVTALFPVLGELADRRAGNLSGGEQQMLALAMVLVVRPRLLMIDELSLGLSPAVVARLMELVDHLRGEGTSLLIVEQSIDVALALADRAVFLERGEVRYRGPAADLRQRPDLLRSVFLGSASSGVQRSGGQRHAGGTQQPAGEPHSGAPPRARRVAPPDAAVQPETTALRARDLSLSFGGVRAVDAVCLDVAPGEIVGIVGPNGAGKTTLFDLLSGFHRPDSGEVFLDGVDVGRLRPAQRARRGLGRSFQDARLFSSLTVDEAIAAALERWARVGDPLSAALRLPNAHDSERRVRRRVDELVELVGLGQFRSLFVAELSTGTRRVVDLACLLAHRPRVVLLDEPATGIAQREVEALVPLIRRIRDELKASVVLIEHDIPLVEEVGERLVALDRGRVIAVGSPSDVLGHPDVAAAFLGAEPRAVAEDRFDDESPTEEDVSRAGR